MHISRPAALLAMFCALLQVPIKGQTAVDHYYYVVQGDDTLSGYYDTLPLADGPFEQNIHTVFRSVEIELQNSYDLSFRSDTARFVHSDNYLIRGALMDGEPSGEWTYALSDFRGYHTCYGGLDWKRIDYTNPDTLSIYYWYGMDRELRSGERVSGYRGDHHNWTYQCREGQCLINYPEKGQRWKVPESELDMVLWRICFHGMRELEYLVD
jgi:hypothetical protein